MRVIISNTTPINYLVLIDQIDVLHHLYGRVLIPQAVCAELQAEGTPSNVNSVAERLAFCRKSSKYVASRETNPT